MKYVDRVYGNFGIEEPVILELIKSMLNDLTAKKQKEFEQKKQE